MSHGRLLQAWKQFVCLLTFSLCFPNIKGCFKHSSLIIIIIMIDQQIYLYPPYNGSLYAFHYLPSSSLCLRGKPICPWSGWASVILALLRIIIISTLFIARADERPSLSQKADNYNCFALCTGKYDLYFVCIGKENFNLSQAEYLRVLEYVYAVIQTNETLIWSWMIYVGWSPFTIHWILSIKSNLVKLWIVLVGYLLSFESVCRT